MVALRRSGVPVPAALAYWLGNPSLNLAVFAFAAFVLPWQWVALRAVSGALLVFVAVPIIARLAVPEEERREDVPPGAVESRPAGTTGRDAGRRFVRSLARLALTLVPEYVVIVLLLGALRGLLFPLAHLTILGTVGATIVFAIAGTLFAIPTAGEIPIVQGMLAAGAGNGPAAALLITLPAVSLPSLVMVGRSFPRRVTLSVAAAVALLGIASGLVAAAVLG